MISNDPNGQLVEKQIKDAYSKLRSRSYEVYLAEQAKIVAQRILNIDLLLECASEDFKALKNDAQREYYMRSRYGKSYDALEHAVDELTACESDKRLAEYDVAEARALLRLYLSEVGAPMVSDTDA
jgi:hypothetical protein